jgi:hypothetical protein
MNVGNKIKLLQVEDNWHVNQVSHSQLGSGSYYEQTGFQEIQRLYQDQIKKLEEEVLFLRKMLEERR